MKLLNIKIAEIDGRGRRGRGVFAYHAPEYPLVRGFSRQPLLDGCRQLKSLYGVTGRRVGLFREGRETPDISCSVEAGAATTVKEPSNGGIRFGKYVDLSKVFPRERKAAQIVGMSQSSQNPVLTAIEAQKPLQNGGLR
jgi:hypothetical protein